MDIAFEIQNNTKCIETNMSFACMNTTNLDLIMLELNQLPGQVVPSPIQEKIRETPTNTAKNIEFYMHIGKKLTNELKRQLYDIMEKTGNILVAQVLFPDLNTNQQMSQQQLPSANGDNNRRDNGGRPPQTFNLNNRGSFDMRNGSMNVFSTINRP